MAAVPSVVAVLPLSEPARKAVEEIVRTERVVVHTLVVAAVHTQVAAVHTLVVAAVAAFPSHTDYRMNFGFETRPWHLERRS